MKQLLNSYSKKEKTIKKRLKDFKKIKNKDLFYELCFCILTPQSNAKNCWNSVIELKKRNFLNNDLNPKNYLKGVRFHNNKSKYLLEAKENFKEIKNKLNSIKDSKELREWLVKNVKGYGYKEAAHFLRNTGHENLAILDRHILKNLHNLGILEKLPTTLTKKQYFEIESKFQKFSTQLGISMDELDLLFWSHETGEIFK